MSTSSATPNPFSPDLQPTTGPVLRASVVNRTHRVVRERARTMQAQRRRNRALLVPLAVASALVIIMVSAFWAMFDEYEISSVSFADSRFHLPILLIWFLPVTAALLVIALLRRLRSRSASSNFQSEETR